MGSGQPGGLAFFLGEAQISIAWDRKGAQCRHIQDTSLEVEKNSTGNQVKTLKQSDFLL